MPRKSQDKKGIYIMGNDKAIDASIALINSIRKYDKDIEICLIPYDENSKKIIKILKTNFNVMIYPNLELIKKISEKIQKIFGKDTFARPKQFRKQACWFGPFDKFLYIDTDIVVFEKITNNLKYLNKYFFICCDYERNNGIKNLFKTEILSAGILKKKETKNIFNAGFWGGKKGIFSENSLLDALKLCKKHMKYFDFSTGVSDMPIFNFLVIKKIKKKINLTQRSGKRYPGNWAGTPHFIRKGNKLIGSNGVYLKYLHWAGMKIQPGCPYWDIWKYYRRLGPGKDIPMQFGKKNIITIIKDKLRKIIKQK